MKRSAKPIDDQLNERLAAGGFRFTSQREHVFEVLLKELDHPTAEQVFLRAKRRMPDISMATVYNCLDALVKCRLVRLVNLDRDATRYCPNMDDHCHFYCDQCGGVYDINFKADDGQAGFRIPEGFQASVYEVSIRGTCSDCGGEKKRGT